MCTIEYKVSGSDVNDHMVMETHSYYAFSLRHIYNFLNDLGFSRQKLNSMKVCFHEQRSHIQIAKPLMFGTKFNIELRIRRLDYDSGSFEITYTFLNSSNERCASIRSECQIKRMNQNDLIKSASRRIIDQIHIFSD